MSRTLTISDELYRRLEEVARRKGFAKIEQLLEYFEADNEEIVRRQTIVEQTRLLRQRIFATHGEMPDSVALLREDRER